MVPDGQGTERRECGRTAGQTWQNNIPHVDACQQDFCLLEHFHKPSPGQIKLLAQLNDN